MLPRAPVAGLSHPTRWAVALGCVLLVASIAIGCSKRVEGPALPEPTASPMRLGPYSWQRPSWWSDVHVRVPARLAAKHELDVWTSGLQSDDGTTRRMPGGLENVKIYAIARAARPGDPELPFHLALLLAYADRWAEAAAVRADLYELAKARGDNPKLLAAYAHHVGTDAVYAGDNDLARHWFTLVTARPELADEYDVQQARAALHELGLPDVAPSGLTEGWTLSGVCHDYSDVSFTDEPIAIGRLRMRPLRGSRPEREPPHEPNRFVLDRVHSRFVTEVVRIQRGDLGGIAQRWAEQQRAPSDVHDIELPGAEAAFVVTLSNAALFAGAVFVAAPDASWRVTYRIEGDDIDHGRCERLVRRLARQVRVAASDATVLP